MVPAVVAGGVDTGVDVEAAGVGLGVVGRGVVGAGDGLLVGFGVGTTGPMVGEGAGVGGGVGIPGITIMGACVSGSALGWCAGELERSPPAVNSSSTKSKKMPAEVLVLLYPLGLRCLPS